LVVIDSGNARQRSVDIGIFGKRHPSRLFEASVPATTSVNAIQNEGRKEEDKPKPSLLSILWRFARPHTIIGSALAIPALHVLASPSYADAFSVRSVVSIVYAMIPALLMNLYITGLNQVTDVEIDKINKPDLPIAAGDLSLRGGIVTVVISLALSFALAGVNPALGTEGLNVALGVSALLGTLYSLPPIRLKRFPFLAALCIVAVRGAVINAGFFAHAKVAAYGGTNSVWNCLTTDPRCLMSSLYFAVFGVVIALMKDVPDVKGDGLSNVRTFSVRLGPNLIYRWMHQLLTGLFWGVGLAFFRGAAVGSTTSWAVRCGRALVGLSSVLAGVSVQREAAPVDPENSGEVYGFYMHLWKLFYLSYLVLPLAR
jgi:homogentisate phytyltransferase / homogentisate geranylgeranyltransferase